MGDKDDTLLDAGARSRPSAKSKLRPDILAKSDVPQRGTSLLQGTLIDGYAIEDVLAEGGFGVVYRATHALRDEKAAIKVLHADLVTHTSALLRFQREIEAVQCVRHPNVIEILSHGSLPTGEPYFVMELLEGMTLAEYVSDQVRLPPEEVLEILTPLAGALNAAHAQAIVHRDIKASNVFLRTSPHGSSSGGGRLRFHVMLLDFGVAKLLDAEGPAITSSRHIVGTFTCISPEQLLGRPVDARTDVYALGALTYRMLVGELPFERQPPMMLRQLHLHAMPPRPSSRARVNPVFDKVILGAMSKDPAARPPTADAFLAFFRAALKEVEASGRRSASVSARRGLSIYIEVQTDEGALDNPEEALLADLDSILPSVSVELTKAGFSSAVEMGTSALFIVDCPDDVPEDEKARRRTLDTALALSQALRGRNARDPRVHVSICVHTGSILLSPEGKPMGGGLLELAAWVPEDVEEGVFASPEVLAGLGFTLRLRSRKAGGLLRIDGA